MPSEDGDSDQLEAVMADVFISYSKGDRDLALKLSTFLEAEGWTVWWDRSLGAGDAYRDEIMNNLIAARAVIAIWLKPAFGRTGYVRKRAAPKPTASLSRSKSRD